MEDGKVCHSYWLITRSALQIYNKYGQVFSNVHLGMASLLEVVVSYYLQANMRQKALEYTERICTAYE